MFKILTYLNTTYYLLRCFLYSSQICSIHKVTPRPDSGGTVLFFGELSQVPWVFKMSRKIIKTKLQERINNNYISLIIRENITGLEEPVADKRPHFLKHAKSCHWVTLKG